MKKRIFDIRLFKEQFKQLRLTGFIGVGLLSLMAILIPVGRAMSIARDRSDGMDDFMGRISVSVVSSHAYMYIIFTMLVPLLALICFHYLTQRNSSDFYHSMPHTRTCIYFCSVGAVIAWATIAVWVPVLLSVIVYTILNQYFILEIALLLRFAFYVYLASLLVIAAISISCSITGTVFTNVIVAGIIIFLPRIIMIVFAELITSNTSLLVTDRLFPLIDFRYNIIFALLMFVFNRAGGIDLASLLFSVVLTIAYFGLGLLAFKRRRSEAASQAAVSRKVQTIIRLLLGFTVSLFPISMIINFLKDSSNYTGSNLPLFIYSIVILYLVAILVMLLYELLTTKKFKNVVKALPSIGYLAILNVIVVIAAFGIYKSMMSYSPDADDISYIVTDREADVEETKYYDTLANSIEMKDPDTLALISNSLKDTIKREKGEAIYMNEEVYQLVVGIHSGLTTHYRRLWIKSTDYLKLVSNYSKSKDYIDAYQNLPELKGNKLSLENTVLSDEDYLTLYNTAREEIKTLDFKTWYAAINSNYTYLDRIHFYATVNSDSLMGTIPIGIALPKTSSLYLKLISSANNKNLNEILTRTKNWLSEGTTGEYSYNFDFTLSSLMNDHYAIQSIYSDEYSNMADIQKDSGNLSIDYLKSIVNTQKTAANFDASKDYLLKVDFYCYSNQTYKDKSLSCIFILDNATGSKLMQNYETPTNIDSEIMQ